MKLTSDAKVLLAAHAARYALEAEARGTKKRMPDLLDEFMESAAVALVCVEDVFDVYYGERKAVYEHNKAGLKEARKAKR